MAEAVNLSDQVNVAVLNELHEVRRERDELAKRLKACEVKLSDMMLRNKLLRERPDLPIERLHAYNDLMAKYRTLMAFYDKHVGTPCEEIRHKQDVEQLQDRVRVLESEKLQMYDEAELVAGQALERIKQLEKDRDEWRDRYVKRCGGLSEL